MVITGKGGRPVADPLGRAADLHILADRRDMAGQEILVDLVDLSGYISVAVHRQRGVQNVIDHRPELVGLGRKIGLTENFHDRRFAVGDLGEHLALVGSAAGFLLRLRGSGFTEVFNRQLHVAVGGNQRLLAIHHPGSGLLPEVLNHFRGNHISAMS